MHKDIMKSYGNYLLKNYSNLSTMSEKDLCEAKHIAETMTCILKADKVYNEISKLECELNEYKYSFEDMLDKLAELYNDSDERYRVYIKDEINKILG